ncbi:hypothetical protein JOJ87_003439 [Rhodococcus ruber]|nr:hypothetical protein [Rhodococcus ruber]
MNRGLVPASTEKAIYEIAPFGIALEPFREGRSVLQFDTDEPSRSPIDNRSRDLLENVK